ncbi:MAG: Ig-like domain-containing protein, partial [Nocardioides sp.]
SGVTYAPDADYCNDPPGTALDTFTYTLAGGSTATVTVTVTCVNDAPVLVASSFEAGDAAIGNTTLVVNAGDGFGAVTEARKIVSGNILSGAIDADGPGPITVVPGDVTTTDGGTVTLQSDGDFRYRPAASPDCSDTTDSFSFTARDGASPPATDTATVTIRTVGCVWYVDNSAPAGGDGTAAKPFATLAAAETAAGTDDTVFVLAGDGTSTGYGTGFELEPGARLIGEVAGLTVDPDQGGPLGTVSLYPATAGARPQLTAVDEDVIALDDRNEVRGLRIDPSGAGGGLAGEAGDTGGGTIADLRIVDSGTAGRQPALDLSGTAGTFAVSDLTVDTSDATAPPSTAIGVRLADAGTVVFGGSGTVDITTKGAAGLDVQGTALSVPPAGPASDIDSVTVTGSGSGAVRIADATGSTTFRDLSLDTTGASAAFMLNAAGTVQVAAPGTANVTAVGGPAVDVRGTSGAELSFDQVRSTGSSTDGVNLDGLGAGSFTASVTSAIAGAAGPAFDLNGGSGTIAYSGSIGDGAGASAEITGRTGGSVTLSGAIVDGADTGGGIVVAGNSGGSTTFSNTTKTLDTGVADAVSMTSSDGHTLNFTGGGLEIVATSGRGLRADSSGTISVTGSDNTVSTTTGIALDVSATDIGAAGVTFESISSNGAPTGIRLNGTGSAAGLTVTGTGGTCTDADTSGCTGGRIRDGVGADDAGATPVGTGIVLSQTTSPSFTRMWVHDHSNYAIRGNDVVGLTIANSVINGSNGTNGATPYDDSSVWFTNLTGSAAITSTYVSGGLEDNVRVTNSNGSLDRITFDQVTFGTSGNRPANDALLLSSTGAAALRATIGSSTFTSAAGDLLQFSHHGSGPGDLVMNASSFSNAHPAIATGGGGVSLDQSGTSGDTTMSITGNTFRDAVGHAVLIVKANGPSTQAGTFSNNAVGAIGVPNSGSLEGDGLKLQLVDQGSSTWAVKDNEIRGYNNDGLEVLAGGGGVASSGTINTTVTGNTIVEPGTRVPGGNVWGIHYNVGTFPGDTFVSCASIANNAVSAGGAGTDPLDIRLRQRQSSTFRLPGYVGGATDTAAVQAFVNAANGGGNDVAAAVSSPPGGGYVGGAACPLP